MTFIFRSVGLAAAIVLAASACGQKGPLFLPSDDPAKNKTEQTSP